MRSSECRFADVRMRCLLAGAILACLGCAERDEATDSFAYFPQFAKYVSQAGELTIYEGLPHPMDERKYNEELKRVESAVIDGHRFYETPVTVSADIVEDLRTLLSDQRRFHALTPGVAKACGGFHPDWLLIWSGGGQKVHVHVCFGCHEAAVFVDGKRQMLAEMNDVEPFQRALQPLTTNLAPRTD